VEDISRLLLAENYIRWGLPQEAARKTISKELIFNSAVDLGEVETDEFVETPQPPRFSVKGKRLVDLV